MYGTFALPVAATSDDSLQVSSKEKSYLNVSAGDTVVKLFNGAFMHSFAEQKDIASMVEEAIEMTTPHKA